MRKTRINKLFVYFLCLSLFLLTGGFHQMAAEAKDKNLPIGEMISKGDVRFEAKENVWKKVEGSYFSIFDGTKIKTEKGMAVVTFVNSGQVEVAPSSLLSFEGNQNLQLHQGSINFRIPSDGELNIRIGKLTIIKTPSLQATKGQSVAPQKSVEAIGSIAIHSNGSVNIKASQGNLSVLDQDRTVIAALSSKESVTLPSTTVKTAPKVMVAQAGETAAGGTATGGTFLGLSTLAWVGIAAAAVIVGAVGVAAAQDDDDDRIPLCP